MIRNKFPEKQLPKALKPLTQKRRWVNWKWELRTNKNGTTKWTKPPISTSGLKIAITNPKNWTSYEAAASFKPPQVGGREGGTGYVLVDAEEGAFDLDNCRDPATSKLTPWAQAIVDQTDSYVEITPSGKGLRIIGIVKGPHVHRRWEMGDGGKLEVFRRADRYITISGNQLGKCDKLTSIDALIDKLVASNDLSNLSTTDKLKPAKTASNPKGAGRPENNAKQKGDSSGSGLLKKATCKLIERGRSDDEIFDELQEEWGEDYKGDDWLRRDIKRNRGKWEQEHPDKAAALRAPFERALSEYQEQQIKWLWQYLIPENTVVIFEGEGEIGKSRLARYIAAKLSSGKPLPGEQARSSPCPVLICSFSEDPVEQITKPQIRSMDGDLDRVFVVEMPFTLDDEGLGRLEDAIRRTGARLIILDPLADYIPAKANSYKDDEVRRFVMGPLSLLARKHKLTIIAIRHFKKSREDGVKYRGAGSMGFSNVSRISVAFIPDPDAGENEQIFVMGPNKGNWVPKSKRRYRRFEIKETPGQIGELRWLDDSKKTIEQLDSEWRKKSQGGAVTDEAKRFLQRELEHGPVLVSTLKEELPDGCSWKTVERAKQALGVLSKGGFRGKPAEWLLPKHATGIVLPGFAREMQYSLYN